MFDFFGKSNNPGAVRVLIAGLVFTLVPVTIALAQSSSLYDLRFETSWSATTHPLNFPGNPHFSGLIGTTHNDAVSFWSNGTLATPGIKSMAETGSKTLLKAEYLVARQAGSGDRIIDSGGISNSPGSRTISFRVDDSHPLLTLVSMLAPSPDWFVGVTALPLRDVNGWIDQITIDLYVWDAGTDSGASYTSTNLQTIPPTIIGSMIDSPLLVNGIVPRVGRFVITRTPPLSADDVPGTVDLGLRTIVYPNPFSDVATIRIELDFASDVTATVYDLQGRRVKHVFTGFLSAGQHEYHWIRGTVAPGVYILRVSSGAAATTSRLVVTR